MKTLTPITSGEILSEDFLKPMEIAAYRLAKDIRPLFDRPNLALIDPRRRMGGGWFDACGGFLPCLPQSGHTPVYG